MIKVSVVMPVYKAEAFLDDTLESVEKQTLKEIEIICVNDGSPDNSLEILKRHAANDGRIKIIDKPNEGAGAARNAGLRAATGEYLSFLDCDDLFESDMLEKAYAACKEKDADICIFRCDMFDDETGKTSSGAYALRKDYLPEKEPFAGRDIGDRIYFSTVGWAWDKLFRREFIVKNNIEYQNQRTTNDMLFVFSALSIAERIITLENVFAHQRRNSGSSLSVTREKSWDCFYHALTALEGFLKEQGIYKTRERAFINYCVHFSLWNLNSLYGESYHKLYDALRDEYLPGWEIEKYPDDYFLSAGELRQAKRILEMSFDEYAPYMINTLRNSARSSDAAAAELEAIKNSASYKLGRALTSAPRALRKLLWKK